VALAVDNQWRSGFSVVVHGRQHAKSCVCGRAITTEDPCPMVMQ
jgi:hypothetical protein